MSNENGMTDREAAIDAIVRFVVSLDDGDEDLMRGCITDDMIMDITPFNKSGFNYSAIHGKDAVVERLTTAVGQSLDTTHQTGNFRVELHGDTATLSCYTLAQHFRKGHGPPSGAEFQEYFMNGNRYKSTVVREGRVWKIRELEVTPSWSLGNPDVMKTH